jgi:hypothetical protein
MIDHEFKETIHEKISDGKFTAADLPAFFTLFYQLGNENEEIQEEVEGWHQRIQLELAGLGPYGIAVAGGRFTSAPGGIEETDLTFTMAAAEAALIQSNVNVQALTVEAALTGKREHIYHAAKLDPHTAAELDLDQIYALVDDLIEAHDDSLPVYHCFPHRESKRITMF